MRFIIICVMGLLAATAIQAQINITQYIVTYISAEHVYLDSGQDKGLQIGDSLLIKHNANKVIWLQVIYVAEHSASCKILSSGQKIKVGDIAESGKPDIKVLKDQTLKITQPPVTENQQDQSNLKKNRTRISGNLGLEWYQFIDQSASKLNFSQPGIRLSFKAQNLWERPYNIRLRLRSRYNQRQRAYSSEIPQNEWRNRIYEMYFAYEDEQALINFRFGRIISNTFSGVGYIDGGLIQNNISREFRWGIFAGTQPQWQYSDFQTSLQKYGVYGSYRSGDYPGGRLETTLALVGEYHGKIVSREFIYLQSSYSYSKYLNIYQSAEIDYNRTWRQRKTNENMALSSLYLSGNFYLTEWLSGSLSYDNRKNYYTYEIRTLADSLFDHAFRQGVRSTVQIKITNSLRLSFNGGIRYRESESKSTYTYGFQISQNNIGIKGLMISARMNGFSNLYTYGYNPSILLGQSFPQGHLLNIIYGSYIYTLDADQTIHRNHWLRSVVQIELPLRLYLNGQYEYDWGDDRKGQVIMTELGYRF